MGEVLLELEVPLLAPSVNQYWKVAKWGGRYITPKGAEFKRAVELIMRTKRMAVRTTDKYRLEIILYKPDWMTKKNTIKSYDLDNYAKCVCDALFDSLDVSDSQVWELVMCKRDGPKELTHYRLYKL